MIKGINICKSYQSLNVLNNVDIEIEKGEVVSIVGASGAGKSTLLHILGTLDRADKGSLFIMEKELSKMKDKDVANFRNEHIGFVFQFHHLLPEFNAIENVCIPAFINRIDQSKAEGRASELLSLLNLSDRKSHKPSELSGGEQQRVAVARALMNQPSIIFADEPSGNLDSDSSKELHELFFKLRDQFNTTFVIVTHNEELASMADRKLVMKDGNFIV